MKKIYINMMKGNRNMALKSLMLLSLMLLKDKTKIVEQILIHTRTFKLSDYLNNKYISEDQYQKKGRAALIKITRKNRYNIIIYMQHLYADNRLNYVLYDRSSIL